MKKLILTAASVVVLVGLLAGAVNTHEQHKAAQVKQTESLQAKLTTAAGVVSNLQAKLAADQKSATDQFNADQKALCNFIVTHVNTKTVTVPSECVANH